MEGQRHFVPLSVRGNEQEVHWVFVGPVHSPHVAWHLEQPVWLTKYPEGQSQVWVAVFRVDPGGQTHSPDENDRGYLHVRQPVVRVFVHVEQLESQFIHVLPERYWPSGHWQA